MRFANCAVVLLVGLGAFAAKPLSAEEIIAKHVVARGGLDKLRAIQSLRREGHLVYPESNMEMRIVEVVQRPARIRTDVTMQGLTSIDAFDGKEGWRVSPFGGRKDPEKLSADETKSMALEADLDFPFVDAKAKGHTLEALGLEDVEGTPAYKLRVSLKSGDQLTVFIDPDSFMLIRVVTRQFVRGAEQEWETDYGEYERVAGVWMPMVLESGGKGSESSHKSKVVYDRVEANVQVDEKRFAFPEVKP